MIAFIGAWKRKPLLRERIRYYADKVRRARSSGNLLPRLRRKLFRSLYNPSKDFVDYYFRLKPADRRIDISKGFADRRGAGNHRPTEAILRRIVAAYKTAGRRSDEAPSCFGVKGLWAEWIAMHYGGLIQAINSENLESLAAILENFNRERFSTGTGYGYDDCVRYRIPLYGRRSILAAWCHYRNILKSLDVDIGLAAFPPIGNPAGVVSGGRIIPVETLRHAYNGRRISTLLSDVTGGIVVEIGGGFGGQTFQTVRQARPRKYVVFDIPEVAAICSYFLLAAFPDKNIRLFGEGPVSVVDRESYDIAVFPHFSITALEDNSVDLFFNESSFSEMDGDCSRAYLAIVERACRKYFLHINHDVAIKFRNEDSSVSANCIASDLVPSKKFKRLYKRPRAFGRLEDKLFQHHAFLYEKAPSGAELLTGVEK